MASPLETLIAPHLEAMQQIRTALESFSHAERIVILAGVLGSEACEPNRSRTEALVLLSYANRIACDRMEQEFSPEAA